MQKGVVRWSDLSIHQGEALLPDDPGKTVLFTRCMSCHGLQTKIAGTRRDEDWLAQRCRLDARPRLGRGRSANYESGYE